MPSQKKDHDSMYKSQGQFCKKCGAWYGCLGLEPTPELYIKHMVQIFREIKRVLKKDGTVWLNLGSSYSGSHQDCGKDPNDKKYKDGRKGNTGIDTRSLGIAQKGKPVTANKHHIFKPKDLVPIPWMVGLALQKDGWWLRSDIIWHRPNSMPESVKDRPTRSHEYILLLSRSRKYYYDKKAIEEDAVYFETKPRLSGMERNAQKYRDKVKYGGGGTSFQGHSGCFKADGKPINPSGKRNKRDVWTVNTKPFKKAHFATFNPELILPCILAGCLKGGTVLDPFFGSGTTGWVCQEEGRKFVGIELSEEYCNDIIIPRLNRRLQKKIV